MENLGYKNKNIEKKYIKNMQNNQVLKVKNSFLELENDFMELKDKELKDSEQKIKKIQKNCFTSRLLCLKMIWISFKNKK